MYMGQRGRHDADIDVLTDLDADGLVRPDESARIPVLVLVSQVDAFRFLVVLQKLCLIGRVLGFAGGHIRSSRFRFFLFPRSRRLAAAPEDADELLHGVSPKRQVSVSAFSFGDAVAFVRPIFVSGQRTSCSRSVGDYRPGDHHADGCRWD
ncbi:MAG: hypothetical protein J6S33_03100 [Aeriscardovia sp.]|nr:hypothetical protein [Aeriscardovia sp.]